jgi:predicted GNAT family acetyltransferase
LFHKIIEGKEVIALKTEDKNANSNNVYKGIGFKESGTIDNIVFEY